MVIVQFRGHWCNNIGLVLLLPLGWKLHVSCITVLGVQGIPISFAFYAIPIFYIPIFTFTFLL